MKTFRTRFYKHCSIILTHPKSHTANLTIIHLPITDWSLLIFTTPLLLLQISINIFGVINIISVAIIINDTRIPVGGHVKLSIIYSKLKFLPTSYHEVCLEAIQLGIIIARYKHLPWHFWGEFTKNVNCRISINKCSLWIFSIHPLIWILTLQKTMMATNQKRTLQINGGIKQVDPSEKFILCFLPSFSDEACNYFLRTCQFVANSPL